MSNIPIAMLVYQSVKKMGVLYNLQKNQLRTRML